jgi:hypothetical protein
MVPHVLPGEILNAMETETHLPAPVVAREVSHGVDIEPSNGEEPCQTGKSLVVLVLLLILLLHASPCVSSIECGGSVCPEVFVGLYSGS